MCSQMPLEKIEHLGLRAPENAQGILISLDGLALGIAQFGEEEFEREVGEVLIVGVNGCGRQDAAELCDQISEFGGVGDAGVVHGLDLPACFNGRARQIRRTLAHEVEDARFLRFEQAIKSVEDGGGGGHGSKDEG